MTDARLVYITASSDEEAARIAKTLVDEHHAACVSVVPRVRSFFFWEGRTQDEQESLLICKTGQDRLDQLITRVKSLHSYSVPEIIAVPIVAGSQDYLAWLRDSLQR